MDMKGRENPLTCARPRQLVPQGSPQTRCLLFLVFSFPQEHTHLLTDAGVQSLAPLRRLRSLNLAWNKMLTDDGVASLCAAHRLHDLSLQCCPRITDASCQVSSTPPSPTNIPSPAQADDSSVFPCRSPHSPWPRSRWRVWTCWAARG
jgi:hypothetical protein